MFADLFPQPAGRFVDLVLAMQAAPTETEIFAAFASACETLFGPVTLCGYLVAANSQSPRLVLKIPEAAADLPLEEFEDWLRGEGSASLARRRGSVTSLFDRLFWRGQTLGGVVMTGLDLDRADLAPMRLELLACCAGALAGLRRARLSEMVLEALEESDEAITFYDEQDGVIFSNDAYHRIFPHYPGRRDLVGYHHLELYRLDLQAGVIDDPLALTDPEAYMEERERRTRQLVHSQRELQKIRGRTFIYTRTRSRTGATMSRRLDVTEQALTTQRLREREKELHRLAFTDILTGLRNRVYLREQLLLHEERLRSGEIEAVGLLLLDLNGFKSVNDRYGDECGDLLLQGVARRLADLVGEAELLVHHGADEFVLLCCEKVDEAMLASLATQMIAALAEPVTCGDHRLRIEVSIGIALRRQTEGDLATLVADASLAMREAKKSKTSAWILFEPSLRSMMTERLALVEDAGDALREGQLEVFYQPQYNAGDRALVGFEALVRWRHPVRGLVSPEIFVPIMEEYGMIEDLGEWVLQTACREAKQWPDHVRIAVNVSPLQVVGGRFSLVLEKALSASGLPPERLELEITESVFLNDEIEVQVQLQAWKALGVRIALDDFGRGYSGLSYLGAFPFDKIKIDRAFLAGVDIEAPDPVAQVILRAIIDLGRALSMTVMAEGVERQDQLDYLSVLCCAQVQGYFLGGPVPSSVALSIALAS